MYGYIYKTTCLANNKIYIGQHKSSTFVGEKYLGSGKIILLAIELYGKENFTIELLEECDTKQSLNDREVYWIGYFDSRNRDIGYNISSGGESGPCSELQRKAAAEYMRNRTISDETHQKMKKSAKERTLNRVTNNGLISIVKNNECKMVHKEDVESYLQNGWVLGQYKWSDDKKENFKNKYASGSYINKDGIVKFVDNSILQDYLSNGWSLGKKPREQYISNNHKYFS